MAGQGGLAGPSQLTSAAVRAATTTREFSRILVVKLVVQSEASYGNVISLEAAGESYMFPWIAGGGEEFMHAGGKTVFRVGGRVGRLSLTHVLFPLAASKQIVMVR